MAASCGGGEVLLAVTRRCAALCLRARSICTGVARHLVKDDGPQELALLNTISITNGTVPAGPHQRRNMSFQLATTLTWDNIGLVSLWDMEGALEGPTSGNTCRCSRRLTVEDAIPWHRCRAG
eukprot:scaffold1860_cov403-Prasinococcus_capsulatus_cf.AAC.15